jgi:hypothetical protein
LHQEVSSLSYKFLLKFSFSVTGFFPGFACFQASYDSPCSWIQSWYDWLHFGYSHKRRRRDGYPDTGKTKRLEAAWNRIKFWKKKTKIYESQNDDPVLQIDWYERHLMDIGYQEETFEYFRAKKNRDDEESLEIFEWKKMKREGKI